MRFLGDSLWLDESTGMSYLENPDTMIREATGLTFEVTPVYPWPLSVIWNKNASQFATRETALTLAGELNKKIKGFAFGLDSEPPVSVGPFTWQKVRSLRVADEGGVFGELNAGLVAQYFIRNHALTACKMVRADITRMLEKRDDPSLDGE